MNIEEIIELARESGFKVDWQHADVAEIKAQRYVAFANAVIKARDAELQAQSEPVAWMTPMGNVFAKHQLTEAQKADLRPLYTHPAPVQKETCGYDETTGNCTNNPCCRAAPVQQDVIPQEQIVKKQPVNATDLTPPEQDIEGYPV